MLDRNDVKIKTERPARKDPLSDSDAADLLKAVSKVVIARGRKALAFDAKDVTTTQLKGPTGNYRAPMLVRGKTLLVGFSADTLHDWFE